MCKFLLEHTTPLVSQSVLVSGLSRTALLHQAKTLYPSGVTHTNACTHQLVQVQAGDRRMQLFALQESLSQLASCGMYTLAFAGAGLEVQSCASAASALFAAVLLTINACGRKTRTTTELKLKTSLIVQDVRAPGEAQGRMVHLERKSDEDTIAEPLLETDG